MSILHNGGYGRQTGPERGEDGFALVVALLSLVGLTLLATAGYLLSNTDYRINQGLRASTQAFYVADTGLREYLAVGRVGSDTVSYAHPEGTAEVWATRLVHVDPEATLYRVTSLGRHLPAEGGAAERTVQTLALFSAAPFQMNSAFTAPPGLQKNGVAGTLSGFDAATAADCPAAPDDVAGLEVPPGGLTMAGGGGGKGKGGGGTPPGFEGDPPIDETRSAEELLAATGIDWGALRSGAFATADFVVSQDGYPNFGQVPLDEWPFVIADQPSLQVNPTHSGRGTLAVHGDLVVNGAFQWDGIILVGGQFTSNGFNRVRGAIVAGLNMTLGEEVPESQLGNGTWDYQYHSCNVIAALKGIGSLAEEPETWSERI